MAKKLFIAGLGNDRLHGLYLLAVIVSVRLHSLYCIPEVIIYIPHSLYAEQQQCSETALLNEKERRD